MSPKLKIDVEGIAKQFKEMAMEIQQDLQKGVEVLARNTKDHILAQAEAELSSATFLKFEECVGFDDSNPGIWIISIDEKALWIEEGIEPNTDMKPGLLKNATKTSAEGFRYRAIPFDKGKPKSQSTGYEFNLRERVRKELGRRDIPFKKLETDMRGNPLAGKVGVPRLLHKFNVLDRRGRPSEIPGRGNTPALHGVSIYQTLTKSGNVRRDIMTIRTVSSGPASANKWIHPGRPAKKFLERAEEWARREWEQTVLPQILDKYK